MTQKPINLDDGMDDKFNPLFPPPVHSSVDDFNFRKDGLGIFYHREGFLCCDMPTSSWCQLDTTLRWMRTS
jgi:hypothetical protein